MEEGRDGRMEELVLSGYTPQEYRTGRQGVCVQIGLHLTAEFLYLAHGNWRELMGEQVEMKRLPMSMVEGFQSWRYYGVDSDVASIGKMLEKYGNVSNSNWVHAAVGMHSDQLMKLSSHIAGGHFLGFACSLQRLFGMLNLRQVDVLNIDVEGYEIQIFEDYDWVIKPRYISVEVHGDHVNPSIANRSLLLRHIDILHNIFSREGYKQLNKGYTNPNTTGYCTCELQYLL